MEQQKIPMPDAVTATQVDTLLRSASTLMSMFFIPQREPENIPGANPVVMPPEAKIAAEVTFGNICDRLDKILTDDSRWSMEFHKTIQLHMDEQHSGHMEFLRAQSAASKELASPHFRYRPSLHKLKDGNWVAFLGDLTGDPDSVIAGTGRAPSEAVAAFDSIFEGTVPKHMVDWLIAHEQAVSQGVSSPPIPTPNENTKRIVDIVRPTKISHPSRGRKNHRGNRRRPR
jgi:hypothetical protein